MARVPDSREVLSALADMLVEIARRPFAPDMPQAVALAQVTAIEAVALALRELTEAVREPKQPVTKLNEHQVETLGWMARGVEDRRAMLHEHQGGEDERRNGHGECRPVWTLR